jgi:hypothetical protein
MNTWRERLRDLDSQHHAGAKISSVSLSPDAEIEEIKETPKNTPCNTVKGTKGDSGDFGTGISSRNSDPVADAETTLDVPDGPCGLCRSPLSWVDHWPEPGRGAWLCLACADRPRPTLPDIYATLTDEERQRLAADAAGGDDVARELLNAVEQEED